MTWRNWQPDAAWISSCWKPQQWRMSPTRSTSTLFKSRGLTACLVCTDWMHAKYLGSDQYIYASTMFLICYDIGALSPQDNLLQLETAIKRYYKENDTRHQYSNLNRLTLFMRRSGPVKLRGKAAEIQCLCEPLLHYWSACCDMENEQHVQIKCLLEMSCKCEQLLFENKQAFAFSHFD